jgi:hypothetical protein
MWFTCVFNFGSIYFYLENSERDALKVDAEMYVIVMIL